MAKDPFDGKRSIGDPRHIAHGSRTVEEWMQSKTLQWGMVAVAVVVFGGTPSAAEVGAARKAEQEAGARLKANDHCGAAEQFLKANREAPHVDLVFNAAVAADDAGDKIWAHRLFLQANEEAKGNDREISKALASAKAAAEKTPGQQCRRNFEGLSKEELVGALSDLQERVIRLEAKQRTTRASEQTTPFEIPIRDSATMGVTNGDLEVVVFTDYQCPFCSRVHPLMKELTSNPQTRDRATVVYKHFPLSFHKEAKPAAIAALAAREQGTQYFWAFSEQLFSNQRALGPEKYSQIAQEVGLDLRRFERDLRQKKAEYEREIKRDTADGMAIHVRGTPSIFVNGWMLKERTLAGVVKLADEHPPVGSPVSPRYRQVRVR